MSYLEHPGGELAFPLPLQEDEPPQGRRVVVRVVVTGNGARGKVGTWVCQNVLCLYECVCVCMDVRLCVRVCVCVNVRM